MFVKQTFHTSYFGISKKVDVLMWNLQHIFFHMKTKTLANFQICIGVPLMRRRKRKKVNIATIYLLAMILDPPN